MPDPAISVVEFPGKTRIRIKGSGWFDYFHKSRRWRQSPRKGGKEPLTGEGWDAMLLAAEVTAVELRRERASYAAASNISGTTVTDPTCPCSE